MITKLLITVCFLLRFLWLMAPDLGVMLKLQGETIVDKGGLYKTSKKYSLGEQGHRKGFQEHDT